MSLLVQTKVIIEDVLEWGENYSDEQEIYIEKQINSFKYKLEQYLHYNINGYHQLKPIFNYNPKTNKFKLIECESPFKFQVENALNTELKRYT
ncbi:hypothetical protein BA195_10225 [Tenacibaculum soleae]|uniref:Uncharacterized protein n=1 Tax=Tenacibaculum soleae TaxID=447689 RepID=A0A1B9XYB0_9FLAO|nr:hypothetical protein [Tenacibaculum soleae]OCK42543.1 hypothetical protein BA195_10225 [Tenacibaculum soleae]